MCSINKRVLIASQPFIKKTNAREVIGCNHKAINVLWNKVCEEYEQEYGPGIPTSYFLSKAHISIEDLLLAEKAQKKFNTSAIALIIIPQFNYRQYRHKFQIKYAFAMALFT